MPNLLLPLDKVEEEPCYKETWTEEDGKQYTAFPVNLPNSILLKRDGEQEVHQYTQRTIKATMSRDGSISKTCKICGFTEEDTICRVSTVGLSATDYTYNGKTQTPEVTVEDRMGTAVNPSNYTVSYSPGCKKSDIIKLQSHLKAITAELL